MSDKPEGNRVPPTARLEEKKEEKKEDNPKPTEDETAPAQEGPSEEVKPDDAAPTGGTPVVGNEEPPNAEGTSAAGAATEEGEQTTKPEGNDGGTGSNSGTGAGNETGTAVIAAEGKDPDPAIVPAPLIQENTIPAPKKASIDKKLDTALKNAEAQVVLKSGLSPGLTLQHRDIPNTEWKEWIIKTGLNSLTNEYTWSFLSCEQKCRLLVECAIDTITFTVAPTTRTVPSSSVVTNLNSSSRTSGVASNQITNRSGDATQPPEEDEEEEEDVDLEDWIVCVCDWEHGRTELVITWYPTALTRKSKFQWSEEGGYKKFWNICDELVLGLKLYPTRGECLFKSDMLDGFPDKDPDTGQLRKYKRWLEFRHWVLFWFPGPRWGWNWHGTRDPPALSDGSPFTLEAVNHLPGMPQEWVDSIPNLALPKLPELVDVDIPHPHDDARFVHQDLYDEDEEDHVEYEEDQLPSRSHSSRQMSTIRVQTEVRPTEHKRRPAGPWACYGWIELEGLHCIAKGRRLVLTNAKVTHLWMASAPTGKSMSKEPKGKIETKYDQRLDLECRSEAQAASWVESLVTVGVREGEVAECCSVA